jgi:death-on-curing family protein
MKHRLTVQQVADSIGSDVDDVLITLWDSGFEQFESSTDVVFPRQLAAVQKVLGLPTSSDVKSPAYWMGTTSTTPREFASLMTDMGFPFAEGQKTLPKGSIRKLTALAKSLAVTPPPRSEPAAAPSLLEVPLEPQLEWVPVGSPRPVMAFLDIETVEEVHYALARDFQRSKDPIFPAGIRDRNLLASAMTRPATSLGETAKYPTIEMAGAALLHSLVLNHAFHNGNKRTGLVSLLVFLDRNNYLLTCTDKDVFRLVLRLADHALTDDNRRYHPDEEVMILARWLCQNARPIDRTERPMPWRRLKTILAHYDCSMEFTGRDNCVDIVRTVRLEPFLFERRVRTRTLRAQMTVTGDGMEIPRRGVAKIRRQLELDEPNGVDSTAFYDDKPLHVDEWIAKYRRILELLGRL